MLFVTDLDGTLLDDRHAIGRGSLDALTRLGQRGVVRAVATGRSLHSVLQVLQPWAPIDYVLFSSGAGAVRFEHDALSTPLLARGLGEAAARWAAHVCMTLGMNVMIHAPVPDSHRFEYHRAHRSTGCLEGRIARYRLHCAPVRLDAAGRPLWRGQACQILALPPPGDPRAQYAQLCARLPQQHVVRTTSPLDGRSLWLEVFDAGVSKASAASWLAQRHGVSPAATYAVGNDYNDLDLLSWAAHAAVVDNAPQDLKARFDGVDSHLRDGVASAIAHFGLL